MPLGSSSAAPAINPGPSCFSRGNRVAGLPAAAETAPSFSSFAIMAVLGRRGAARRCGSVPRNPDGSLNDPDDSDSGRLAQILRQAVVGIALLELGELALGLGRFALALEPANVLEPLFALLRLGCGDAARQPTDGTLGRRRGFPKSVRARSRGSCGRLRRSDRLLSVEAALCIRQGLCLFALAKNFYAGRDCRQACGLPCGAALAREGGFDRVLLHFIASRRTLRTRRGGRGRGARQI